MWDLYCGVGGFALHCASPDRDVTGIEMSEEAIVSAATSRDELGLPGVRFAAGDATAFALAAAAPPDMVIVNPPRRGIGHDLAAWLEESGVRHVVYSSCNAESLARDLAAMPSLRPTRARLLDMFPQTTHYEVDHPARTAVARRGVGAVEQPHEHPGHRRRSCRSRRRGRARCPGRRGDGPRAGR